jgi:hypothetical protein
VASGVGLHMPAKQCLVTVSTDLIAIGNENDSTCFAIAGYDPKVHNLRPHLREGADPDVLVDLRHRQVCEVSTVAAVDQGIG